jgi:hypothetical protein
MGGTYSCCNQMATWYVEIISINNDVPETKLKSDLGVFKKRKYGNICVYYNHVCMDCKNKIVARNTKDYLIDYKYSKDGFVSHK